MIFQSTLLGRKSLLLVVALSFFAFRPAYMSAQEVWDLQKCIDYALEHNLVLEQNKLNVTTADINLKQNKAARIPSLNGTVSAGANFGRTINPVQNTFDAQTYGYSSIGLSTGVMLYNGGKINNSIKQSAADKNAAELDVKQYANDLALNVAREYINILFAQERLIIAKRNAELSEKQLQQMLTFIKAGSKPENDKYQLQAQRAKADQDIITAQNSIDVSYLNLKQLLMLDADTEIKIKSPDVTIPINASPAEFMLNDIYQTARKNQPGILAGDIKLLSADLGVRMAKSGLYPSLYFGANLSSNYSTLSKNYTLIGQTLSDPVPILVNGQPVNISTYQPAYSETNKPYFKQLDENLGISAGLQLNIPLYSNRTVKSAVERSLVNRKSIELQNLQKQQQLKSDVNGAITQARAAEKQYYAANQTFLAQKAAFESLNKKYELGAVNLFDFVNSKTQMDSAEQDVLISKYDYLFKLKIIDYYQGKRISLE